MGKQIGVITEQGFSAGKLGFDPLKKEDQDKLLEKKKENSEK